MFKNIRISILFLLLFPGTDLFSQQLSQQVLVPVAGVSSASTINYSQTIGETAVEIISSPEYIFTQGFQQPGLRLTNETPLPGTGIDVYPNPATDKVTIKLFGDNSREFRIEVINISGTIVISEKLSFSDNYYFMKVIPLEQMNKGIYFVRIVSTDKIISRTFKIEKM
jgi:hypothetical protein